MLAQFLDESYMDSLGAHSDGYFSECIRKIEDESVAPQVLSIVKQCSGTERLPTRFLNELERLSQKTAGQSLYIRYHHNRVLRVLDSGGISAIPLKGIVFAERYFGHFASRPTSDIDILLKPADLDRAVHCLRSLGFRGPADYNPLHFHCVMAREIPPGGDVLHIELHWSLLHENNALPDWDGFWNNATRLSGYEHILELTTQDTFYAICLHGANHGLDSFRYLIDVAHLVHNCGAEIDYAALFETCRTHGTLRRVKAVLNVVYSEFPSLHRVKPLPYPVHTGWMVTVDNAILNSQFLTPDKWQLRFRIVKEWLCPPREVATWHLRGDALLTSKNVYRRFYRQRFVNLMRWIGTKSHRKEENELHA